MRVRHLLIALLPTGLLAGQQPLTELPPAPADVGGWIADLTAPRLSKRQRAYRSLVRAGERAAVHLARLVEQHAPEQTSDMAVHGEPGSYGEDLFDDPYHGAEALVTIGQLLPSTDSLLELERSAETDLVWLLDDLEGLTLQQTVILRAMHALGSMGARGQAATPGLLRMIGHEDHDLSHEAAASLARIGDPAVSGLIELLADRKRCWAAATVLGAMGSPAQKALVAELGNDRKRTREKAIFALGLLGDAKDPQAVSLLAKYLGSHQQRLARLASWALAKQGKGSVSTLRAALDIDDRQTRLRAIGALGLIGPAAVPALPQLIAMLEEQPSYLGQWCAEAIGRMEPTGSAGAKAVAALRRALLEAPPEARLAAIDSLGLLGQSARPAMKELRALLDDPSPLARRLALRALGRLGPTMGEALPDVVDFLATTKTDRELAVRALGGFGEAALPELLRCLAKTELRGVAIEALAGIGSPALRPLLDLLGDEDEQLRNAAVWALPRLGNVAIGPLRNTVRSGEELARWPAALALAGRSPDSVPVLLELLGDDDATTRRLALAALSRAEVGGHERRAITVLSSILDDSDPESRAMAVEAMQGMEADKALVRALADSDARVRTLAAEGLEYLDVDDDRVRRALTAALTDRHSDVRRAAASALAESSEQRADVLQALRALVDDPSPDVRSMAYAALGAFDGSAEALLPVLAEGLKARVGDIRGGALYALGQFGPRAASLLPAVVVRLLDDHPFARSNAAWAIGRLRPDLIDASYELLELLREIDEEESSQWNSAVGLGGAGGRFGGRLPDYEKPDESSRATIAAQLKSRETRTKRRGLRALRDWRTDDLEPLRDDLLALLDDDDPSVRLAALGTVERLRQDDRLIAALLPRLSDDDARSRTAAAELLGRAQAPRLQDRVAALAAGLTDENAAMRRACAGSLGQLGTDAVSAAKALTAAVADADADVRRAAAAALGQLGRAGPEVVQALLGAALDSAQPVVIAAARSLGGLGSGARAAVPLLLDLRSDDRGEVRGAALDALGRIAADDDRVLLALIEGLTDEVETVASHARRRLRAVLDPD